MCLLVNCRLFPFKSDIVFVLPSENPQMRCVGTTPGKQKCQSPEKLTQVNCQQNAPAKYTDSRLGLLAYSNFKVPHNLVPWKYKRNHMGCRGAPLNLNHISTQPSIHEADVLMTKHFAFRLEVNPPHSRGCSINLQSVYLANGILRKLTFRRARGFN